MNKYYVYIILRKDEIYVGKGCNDRVLQSLRERKGLSYKILERNLNQQEALLLEDFLWNEYHEAKVPLLNNRRPKETWFFDYDNLTFEEWKVFWNDVNKRRSEAIKRYCEDLEARQFRRETILRQYADPVKAVNIKDAATASRRTPEARKKRSEAITRAHQDPIKGPAMREAAAKSQSDPEVNARRSASIKETLQDPEIIQKRKEANSQNVEVNASRRTSMLENWQDEEFKKKQKQGIENVSQEIKEKTLKTQTQTSKDLWKDPEYRRRNLEARTKAKAERETEKIKGNP